MLVIREASEAQIEACWNLNFKEWGDGLSLAQYHGRERAQLEAHPRGRSLGHFQKFWVLVDEGEGDNEILSACETVARPSLLSVPGRDGAARSVETGVVWSVASVFCNPLLRGRGNAGRLMTLLAERIRAAAVVTATERDPSWGNVLGSALFSDIGPDFYARFGWETHPSAGVSILLPRIPGEVDLGTGQGKTLGESDLAAVCEADVARIGQEMQTSGSADTLFTCLPTHDVLQWHHARMRYVFAQRHGDGEPPRALGHYLSEESFILWTMQFSADADEATLYVLRLRHASVGDLAQLLSSAIEAAREQALTKVVIWDETADVVEAARLLALPTDAVEVREMRKGSISALLLCRNRPTGGRTVWLNNEKFGWC